MPTKRIKKSDVDRAAADYQDALLRFGENNMVTVRAEIRYQDLRSVWEKQTGKRYYR